MLVAIGLSLTIIYFRNPVNAVLSFIITFIITASFLIHLGVEFLALVYLLVYIGAVAVLFLFIVMLLTTPTEQRITVSFNGYITLMCVGILY
jgi:NADH-quinone oxidoreductase subunit J